MEHEFNCKNCDGKVVYKKVSGWGHVIATGCVNPAVSMEDWKRYLKLKKEKKNFSLKCCCGGDLDKREPVLDDEGNTAYHLAKCSTCGHVEV